MPANTAPTTPAETIAANLLSMADRIERDGLWLGSPNYADPNGTAIDVPAAAYLAACGRLPLLFYLPFPEAAERARALILDRPPAIDTLRALAAHMERIWPDLDWADDPIERLANWPHLLGVEQAEIPRTMRTLAHSLTAAATTSAAA